MAALAPLVHAAGLDLYDVEVGRGLVRVTVTRPGGVDLDAITGLNAILSRYLDEHDPMPGRYTLEISSPGLERPLRTPAHFASAVGEAVTLRVVRPGEPAVRVSGTLERADADAAAIRCDDGTEVVAPYAEIERARTVFAWGSPKKGAPKAPKPARSRAGAGRRA